LVNQRVGEEEFFTSHAREYSGNFDSVISSMDELASLEGREVPLRFIERRIVDPLEDILPRIEEKVRDIEASGERCDPDVVKAFFRLRAAIEVFKRLGRFRFIYHENMILGIPHKLSFGFSYEREFGKDTAIALISATIETPKFHPLR